MSYDPAESLKPVIALSKEQLKEKLLNNPPHVIAHDDQLIRQACQLVVHAKLSDPAFIRNVFQIKASNSELRSADKWPMPSITQRVKLIEHFREIAVQIGEDQTAFLREKVSTVDSKPPSQPEQYAQPEAEQELPDWLRMAEARLSR